MSVIIQTESRILELRYVIVEAFGRDVYVHNTVAVGYKPQENNYL
jgi:hypothetical protein